MSDNPLFSYTRRDYEGARKEGLEKIPIISKGNWTDLNSTDPGIILLDYVHALVDMMNYYQDHQALESFITTAKERANIFRIAKQLSYDIRSAKGATCEVTFNSDFTYNTSIRIPRHTKISTETGITYLTKEVAYLPIGKNSVTVECSQGEEAQIVYAGTGVSKYSLGNSSTDQIVSLPETNIDIDTIRITDNMKRVWTPVDIIVFSTDTDRVYQADLNPDNTISIRFGDGERGVVPDVTDTLTIQYVLTSAEEGKVSPNSLIYLKDQIYDSEGRYVEFSVSNNKASTGGSTAQTSAEIRELAPGAIKAQNRAVTLADYENLAKLLEGVADAKAYDYNVKPDLCLYHEVKVLILPEEEQDDLDLLKKNVYNYLYQRMIPPTSLQVLTPSNIPIDISLRVKKVDYLNTGEVEYSIQEKVKEYFKNRSHAIGEEFYPMDLYASISNIEGIRSMISMTPSAAVSISDLSLATLGDLNITIE